MNTTEYCSLDRELGPKPVAARPLAWSQIVTHRKPVIQGVRNVIWGNSYRVRKGLLVAGFVFL